MPKVLSVAEVRQVDQLAISQYGLSSLVLMENASRSACDAIDHFFHSHVWRLAEARTAAVDANSVGSERTNQGSLVTILCGSGNNAGDGLVMARHLQLRGWTPQVWMLLGTERLSSDCRANFLVAQKSSITIRVWESSNESLETLGHDLARSSMIIDAMLGSGATGEPKHPLDQAIALANNSKSVRVAVDIPTGLDADRGSVSSNTFQADLTCTFVAPKIGFATNEAKTVLGHVAVCSIGIPQKLLDEVLG